MKNADRRPDITDERKMRIGPRKVSLRGGRHHRKGIWRRHAGV